MKKTNIVILLLILTMIMCAGCSNTQSNKIFVLKGISTFESDLNVSVNNEDRYNESIYLTKDKFYFTSHDNSCNFGNGNKPYVYDLKTGEIKSMLDFDVDDIHNVTVINNKMYFISYTNTSTDWGYCLFEYDINTEDVTRIYETPNTVDSIVMACFGDTIIYACSVSPQNLDNTGEYEIHKLKNGNDTVIKNQIISIVCDLIQNENGAYFTFCQNNDMDNSKSYFIDKNGNLSDSDFVPDEDDYYYEKETEYINDKIISARFGDYYILEDKIPDKETSDGDCGYEYQINYYLYNAITQETHTLTSADYWYYYI